MRPANSGDREISNEFTKSGYPLGVTININGERFFDEGSDLRNYTYAKFGRAILEQPQGVAFQVWDQKGIPWLRSEEYRDEIVKRLHGNRLRSWRPTCAKSGLENPVRFVETLNGYNDAAHKHRKEQPELKWNPAIAMDSQRSHRRNSWRCPNQIGRCLLMRDLLWP